MGADWIQVSIFQGVRVKFEVIPLLLLGGQKKRKLKVSEFQGLEELKFVESESVQVVGGEKKEKKVEKSVGICEDVLVEILKYLECDDLRKLCLVSKYFYVLSSKDMLWEDKYRDMLKKCNFLLDFCFETLKINVFEYKGEPKERKCVHGIIKKDKEVSFKMLYSNAYHIIKKIGFPYKKKEVDSLYSKYEQIQSNEEERKKFSKKMKIGCQIEHFCDVNEMFNFEYIFDNYTLVEIKVVNTVFQPDSLSEDIYFYVVNSQKSSLGLGLDICLGGYEKDFQDSCEFASEEDFILDKEEKADIEKALKENGYPNEVKFTFVSEC